MDPKSLILIALAAASVFYVAVWLAELRKKFPTPSTESLLTGFVTNFFDTLGIGSFAPSTAIFKFRRMVPDELIPGTLNAGHTLPVILQAFLYIAAIQVDPLTLVLLILAATAGGWFGAGLVAHLPRRTVQYGVGAALLVAVIAMLMRQLDLFPQGGSGLGLEGWRLAAGVAGNFLFGAISTLGIGFYAPCMTMVSLLGMSPAAAFPIMMGSSAFLMPTASARFIRSGAYLAPVALGLTLGGLAGVPLAAFVVKSMPLTTLRWLVIVVVLYAAVVMLRSAMQAHADGLSPAASR
jgi:uncharacterized membrane protein YfcA